MSSYLVPAGSLAWGTGRIQGLCLAIGTPDRIEPHALLNGPHSIKMLDVV